MRLDISWFLWNMARHKVDKTKLYQFNYIPKKINTEVERKNRRNGFTSLEVALKFKGKLFIHKLKVKQLFEMVF